MNGQEGNEEQVGTADASSVDGAANSARTGTPVVTAAVAVSNT